MFLPFNLCALFLFLCLGGGAHAQCPPVSGRCTCESSVYEPVSISCEGARSLSEVLQSMSGARGIKVDRLAIVNTPVNTLPPYAFDGFQITALVMRQNGLASIDPNAFSTRGGGIMDSITELNIQQNRLGQIPRGAVSKLPNLRKLILSDNSIGTLPPRAFATYESKTLLEKLDLSGNQLSGIGTVSLEGLSSLKEISFEKNMFANIPRDGLKMIRETLEDLNFGLNKISQVPVGILDFPVLKSLSLEFNNIQTIQPEAFRRIPNLLYLYIGGNKFPKFDPEMFRYLTQLEILGIGDTNIQQIPEDAFKYTPRLRILEMSDAAVTNIQEGAFQRIRSTIQRIVMNKNQLTSIRADMFRSLTALQSLDLQGNQLSNVEDRSWANLPSLRHLDISNNQLRTLEPQTFTGTFTPGADTRTLYICGNPWTCDERLNWFREWLRRDLEIQIDKRPVCISECAEPDFLNHLYIRDMDPVTDTPPPFTITPVTAPIVQGAVMSSIGWIILAIILAILLTSICLLAMVRYFIGRRRRQEKEREEEERILRSSAVSGYQAPGSVVGSAYPGSAVDLDLPPATTLDVPERSYWPY